MSPHAHCAACLIVCLNKYEMIIAIEQDIQVKRGTSEEEEKKKKKTLREN